MNVNIIVKIQGKTTVYKFSFYSFLPEANAGIISTPFYKEQNAFWCQKSRVRILMIWPFSRVCFRWLQMPGFEKTRFYEASVRFNSRSVGSCASSTSFKRLFRPESCSKAKLASWKSDSRQKFQIANNKRNSNGKVGKILVDRVSEELKSWPPSVFPTKLCFEPRRARFVPLQVATGARPASTDLRNRAPTYFSSSCRAARPYRPQSPRICAALVETSALAKKVCFLQTYCQNAVADKHICVSGARER